ncbi:MAG: caspase family protein [Deferribacteraceae bacterium]|jgi:WD40 repeat protein|nr:caspase family protein [Deferribacteraceae bacterium]
MIKKGVLLLILLTIFPVALYPFVEPTVQTEEAFTVTALKTTPDGNTIIAAVSDGAIRQFAASSGIEQGNSLKLPGRISDIAVTGEGKFLLAASDKVYIISLTDNSLRVVDAPRASVVAADYAGLRGAGVSGYTITYYNLESGRRALSFRAPSEVYACAIDSPAGMFYAAGKDGAVRAYTMPGGNLSWEYQAKIGVIRSLAVSSDKIIVGGDNGVRIFSRSGKDIKELVRHTDTVRTVSITPDGRFAVTGGDDGVPVVWDTVSYRADNVVTELKLPVNAAAVDPYFRYVAVTGSAAGEMGGNFTIQYTANKHEVRRVYIFRDATLTLNGAGYVSGAGTFGKYLSYKEGSRKYTFGEISGTVHKPEKLHYNMPIPKISQPTDHAEGKSFSTGKLLPSIVSVDTTPPVISINERGFQSVSEDEIKVIEGRITDESGVAWAKTDEKPLKLDHDGNFRIETVVPEGGKSITISAADVYGNVAVKTVALGAGTVKNVMKSAKVALLIGVNRYKHLPALRTPEYGVKILGELLRSRYGYEVIQLTGANATRDGIMSEINRLRKTMGKGSSFILYYAGHGYLDNQTGNPYWQPYDADPGEDTRWILTSQITSALAAYAAGQILIISDSCYSGNASGYIKGGENLRVVISAGGNEPVADTGAQGHSVFTAAVINALKQEPRDSEKLFEFIKTAMGIRQTPRYEKLSGEGKYILENFYQ